MNIQNSLWFNQKLQNINKCFIYSQKNDTDSIIGHYLNLLNDDVLRENILQDSNNYFTLDYNENFDHIKFDSVFNSIKKQYPENPIYMAFNVKNYSFRRKYALLTNLEGTLNIYLNNRSLYSRKSNYNKAYHYTNYDNIKLRFGINRFFIEIKPNAPMDKMVIDIAKPNHALYHYHQCFYSDILCNSVLNNTDSLQFRNGYYPQNLIKYEIYNVFDSLMVSSTIKGLNKKIPINQLSKGIYRINLQFKDYLFKETFSKGLNPDKALINYQNYFEELKQNERVINEIEWDGLLHRLNHILKFKMHLGQRISKFELKISNDNKNWNSIFLGESIATNLTEGRVDISSVETRYFKIIGHMSSFYPVNTLTELYIKSNGKNIADSVPLDKIKTTGNKKDIIHLFDNNYKTEMILRNDNSHITFDFNQQYLIDSISIAWARDVRNLLSLKEWQAKLMWVLHELEYNKLIYEKGLTLNRYRKGLHLNGYYSAIDSQVCYYLIQIPQEKNVKLPVAINTPFQRYHAKPFLESTTLADVWKLKKTELQVEKTGIAMVWAPGYVYARIVDDVYITSMNDLITNISIEYNIDKNRTYLIGSCSGAYFGMGWAVYHPDYFAGMSYFSPVFSKHVKKHTSNISNIPIFMRHSVYDEHSPYEDLHDFNILVEQNNLDFTYDILDNESHNFYSRESYPMMFDFLKRKKITPIRKINFTTSYLKYNQAYWLRINSFEVPNHVTIKAECFNNTVRLSSNNIYHVSIILEKLEYNENKPIKVLYNDELIFQGKVSEQDILDLDLVDKSFKYPIEKNSSIEGPISHAYSKKFLIVKGTLGDEKETNKINIMCNTINKKWASYYLGEVKEKKDIEIEDYDVQNYNLILIGNSYNNSYIKKISEKLPLTLDKDLIKIGNKEIMGKNLSVHIVYPNPLNENKYIVQYGAFDIHDFQFKNQNIFNKMEDYYVFSKLDGNVELIESGRFNMGWE